MNFTNFKNIRFFISYLLSAKKIFGLPQNEWAALAAAREKIGLLPDSRIVVSLYDSARTHFIKKS